MLSRQDLVCVLNDASIGEVRLLLMHSSLHSLGRVEHGADSVVDAVLEVIGDDEP